VGYRLAMPATVPSPARAHLLPSAAVGRVARPVDELFAHRPMGTQD
jgi:hypothetical protein